ANGTAYMAMPRLVGKNLREVRKTLPVPPSEAWARRVFDAVLGGLEALHAQNVWHRDVAPDNIFLPADGSTPILLDFGAARQAIGDRTQVFTAILKPSFAPIEQYAEAASLKQGPWTDFYALAAVMHELLTGRPPPPCTARAMGDELAPLSTAGYSSDFLAALDWALRVPPHQRPQSAAAWRDVVEGRAAVPPPQAAAPRALPPAPAPSAAPAAGLDIEFADTVQALPEDVLRTTIVPAAVTPTAPGRRPKPLLLAGAGVLALALLGLFIAQMRGREVPSVSPSAAGAALAASAPSSVPAEPAPSAVSSPAPVVMAVEAASAPRPASAALAKVASAPATVPASSSAPRAASAASASSRRDGALKPILTEKAGEFRPVPRSPVFAAPEPAASATAAPHQTAPASTAAAPEPRSPSEACGSRMLLARAWCIDRECEKPIFRNHAECVKLRELRHRPGDGP
ncbi:MAG TPA: hypothetical protein VIN58_17290, partial [Roseateles sp.]